jgi:hypothetical protein
MWTEWTMSINEIGASTPLPALAPVPGACNSIPTELQVAAKRHYGGTERKRTTVGSNKKGLVTSLWKRLS